MVVITAFLGTVAVTSVSEAGVNALLWASGFVFLTLATDSEGKWAIALQVLSALVLMILALLGHRFGIEFTIMGTWILALWVAAAANPATRSAH
jgi:hypothetical protein